MSVPGIGGETAKAQLQTLSVARASDGDEFWDDTRYLLGITTYDNPRDTTTTTTTTTNLLMIHPQLIVVICCNWLGFTGDYTTY